MGNREPQTAVHSYALQFHNARISNISKVFIV